MTAYLQPGDKIHIAFPITILTIWDQNDVNTHVRQMGAELTKTYAAMGVEVVGYTSSTSLDRPTVVAVVRASKSKFDPLLPNHWQVRGTETKEPPRAKEFLPHGLLPE